LLPRLSGGGEYDHPLPPYEREDEIRTLHDAFVNMQDSIQRAFAELTRKAELERSLMEERMRVLTYQHRLKDAELLALQTQINPHFLYNTLAAGWQLALTEGNEKTAEFLEKLAAFIRYALKPSTRFVLVSEEIELRAPVHLAPEAEVRGALQVQARSAGRGPRL
jgi:sensor histidine kinase YesM